MRRNKWWIAAPLGVAALLGGCAGGDDPPDALPGSQAPVGSVSAALSAARDCDDLLGKLQLDAIAKVDLAVEWYRKALEEGELHGNDRGAPGRVVAETQAASLGDVAEQGGGFDNSTAGGEGARPSGPSGFSDTNTQVADVDEADIVKVAEGGERIYLLHGSQLFAIHAWPAADMSLYGEPVDIEGIPQEMFVHDGKAVIFSSIDDHGSSRFERSSGANADDYRWRPFTKVTVVDVSDESPEVLRELYYEGSYTSSRRHDGIVRIVMQASREYDGLFYPDVEPYDAWGRLYDQEVIDAQLADWRARTVASIQNTVLGDWLPDTYEGVDGAITLLDPACDGFYIPPAGIAGWGLTRLVGMELSNPSAVPTAATVMGAASIVYSNHDTLVLAQPDYREGSGFLASEQTMLHVFDIESTQSSYRSSGWIAGHPLNQFAIDVQDDVVRVSTTGWERTNPDAKPFSDGWWERDTVNQVFALRDQDGLLEVASTSGPIGHENETIHSTRFLGDRAYVVTFEQTDPLIVVDMSDADDLQVLGEVEIPGFSTYMHPLDDDHLLTIGQSGTWGVQMQIFDVSDDLNPVRTHVHDYGNSSSEAQWNHKAFTFYAEQNLLAIPLESYGQEYRTGLDVLRISADDGFEALGMVDHSPLSRVECERWQEGDQVYEECWPAHESSVRRGLFINDEDSTYVYSVGFGGVMVHELDALDAALATIALPEARYNHGEEGDWGWDDPDRDASGPAPGIPEWDGDEARGDGDAEDVAEEPTEESDSEPEAA
ncbi:MAG: beta-propeller domain-containing protein [Myxococcales bacterium]|nr:beta-propeller domain-containing protein [Myxococcales bacterium]